MHTSLRIRAVKIIDLYQAVLLLYVSVRGYLIVKYKNHQSVNQIKLSKTWWNIKLPIESLIVDLYMFGVWIEYDGA